MGSISMVHASQHAPLEEEVAPVEAKLQDMGGGLGKSMTTAMIVTPMVEDFGRRLRSSNLDHPSTRGCTRRERKTRRCRRTRSPDLGLHRSPDLEGRRGRTVLGLGFRGRLPERGEGE